MNYQKIKQLLLSISEENYRFQQIIDCVFKQRKAFFSQMNVLPKSLKALLISEFGDCVYSLNVKAKSTFQQAEKILFSLKDGNCIEAVNLRYKKRWESFCISSQCGCSFGCQFCATGTMGLKRNLSAEEIIDQLLFFYLNGHNLNSVSFMGMGEPLGNPNLFDALKLLIEPKLFGLSQRKITVSTIGIVPNLERLTREMPQINVAFSLHSPFENQRSELMPINKKYSTASVFKILNRHVEESGRQVFLAYILLRGINDSLEHAKALTSLVKANSNRPHLYHVDLIAYNETKITQHKFKPSTESQIKKFYEYLRGNGISVTTRMQFGTNINAGCGQLYGE